MARQNKSVREPKVATGPVVQLRHVTRTGDWRMYFYDGELSVVDSVLTIPADRPEWIKRAWIQGFRMTAAGRVIADLAKEIRAQTVGAVEAQHADVDDDFLHSDDPETCLCLAPVVTEEMAAARLAAEIEADKALDACCSDECCQPESEEDAVKCCAEGDDCCTDDEGAGCACTPVVETETAESGEETDEGPADGGQSPDDDGVQSSESAGDGSLPEGGVDGRVGDEPADGGEGD